jgi:hypothetical protein
VVRGAAPPRGARVGGAGGKSEHRLRMKGDRFRPNGGYATSCGRRKRVLKISARGIEGADSMRRVSTAGCGARPRVRRPALYRPTNRVQARPKLLRRERAGVFERGVKTLEVPRLWFRTRRGDGVQVGEAEETRSIDVGVWEAGRPECSRSGYPPGGEGGARLRRLSEPR